MEYIKYGIMIVLILLSFYFSDKLLLYVESLSPLMKEIEERKPEIELPVNALIDGNTIVPGKNGKEVNIRESYLKMNEFRVFNDTFYVFDEIKPDISLYDNLDKVIIRGNSKSDVSLIVDNKLFESYLLENKIKFNKIIINGDDIEYSDIEYINGGKDETSFKELNVYFNREKINKKICVIGYSSSNYCYKNDYFKVDPTIHFYKSNLSRDKDKIDGGSIIFIHDNLSLSECKILLNYINSNNFNIVYLSDLISE